MKNNHGGARVGAGRKSVEDPKKTFSIRLKKSSMNQISKVAEAFGCSQTAALEHIIHDYSLKEKETDTMINPATTQSYHIGELLGIMAKPLGVDKLKPSGFVKQYVAYLSKNIKDIDRLRAFSIIIREKLHKNHTDIMKPGTQVYEASVELNQIISKMENEKEYNDIHCGLGFYRRFDEE